MLSLLQEKAVLLNSQFIEYAQPIHHLANRLMRDVELLELSPIDLVHAKAFVRDYVTIFRFLKEAEYDAERAHEWLLDTVRWRQEQGIADMSYMTSANDHFYSDSTDAGGFAFFHKQDRLGRPIVVVRMRHFPQLPKVASMSLTELIRQYACLVMEMARKIMYDITQQREQQGVPCALVSHMVVIIDTAKAPFIPIDAQLVKAMIELMEKRFPDFVGSIYVMNFGWMYQGLWQMIKYLLSDEARSRISFPTPKELLEVVPEEDLLQELGGIDPYSWSLDTDIALARYGIGPTHELPICPLQSPPLSVRSSRASSVSSDAFFDVSEVFHSVSPSISSTYATPGTSTPVPASAPAIPPAPSPSPPMPQPAIPATPESAPASVPLEQPVWAPASPSEAQQPQYSVYYWTGLHMGAASFLTSFIKSDHEQHPHIAVAALFTSQQPEKHGCGIDGFLLAARLAVVEKKQMERQETDRYNITKRVETQHQHHVHFPHLLPPDDPHSAYALAPVRVLIHRIEHRLVRWARRMFRLSFAYKGAVYWVALYIFLRGPTEQVLKRALATVADTPQVIKYTTVGVTAAMAAGIGSSVTASIDTAGPRLK